MYLIMLRIQSSKSPPFKAMLNTDDTSKCEQSINLQIEKQMTTVKHERGNKGANVLGLFSLGKKPRQDNGGKDIE